MQIYEGKTNAAQMRFGIVVSRFNEMITRQLLIGAIDTLKRCGAQEKDINIAWVPGAFEIGVAAKKFAESERFDAVICLGAVIRGDTPHFDYVAGPCANAVSQISLDTGIPTIFGVITTNTLEQAIERAGTKAGNKGSEAAFCAIEMVDVLRQIDAPQRSTSTPYASAKT